MHYLIRKLLNCFKIPQGRRQYFDEDLAREQWDLLESAALLQVTEFRIFELAYKDWYGAAAKHQVVEAHFRNYMFNQIVPVWVSHFCRRIVKLGRSGELDPKKFGIYQRLPSRRMIRIGQAYTAMLLMAFFVMVYMAYGDHFTELLISRTGHTSDVVGLPQHNIMP